ncbi:MAG: hypothetical protein U0325_30985 [Polyangiales bacterium]
MRRAALALALTLCAPAVLAQSTPDVASAAAAFQEGQRAQLARDFARAAEMFELADGSAPSSAALRSAVRNHQAAGHNARAATLALRMQRRDANDPQSVALAAEVLAALSPRLARISLRCTPSCALVVDAGAVSSGAAETHDVFTDPGEHALEASWGPGRTRRTPVTGAAGAQVTLILDAPPEPPPAPAPPEPPPAPAPVIVVAPPPPPPVPAPAPVRRRPLSPAVFWSVLGATAVSGGVLSWSGVDTLGARDRYVAAPSERAYLDGVGMQTRTNVLIATTATLAAAAALTAVFTEWSGGRTAQVGAAVTPLPGGMLVGMVRSF